MAASSICTSMIDTSETPPFGVLIGCVDSGAPKMTVPLEQGFSPFCILGPPKAGSLQLEAPLLPHKNPGCVGAVEETIYPTSTRGKLLISAVTPSRIHLFGHRPDHCAGHSLVACPFADNSSPHVYLKLLASLLPPSTTHSRQSQSLQTPQKSPITPVKVARFVSSHF